MLCLLLYQKPLLESPHMKDTDVITKSGTEYQFRTRNGHTFMRRLSSESTSLRDNAWVRVVGDEPTIAIGEPLCVVLERVGFGGITTRLTSPVQMVFQDTDDNE